MRLPTKYVEALTTDEEMQLKEIVKNSRNNKKRLRAEIILLSNKKYSINEIENIKDLDRDTISLLINKWQQEKLAALNDKDRTGRPRKLTTIEETELINKVKQEPKNLKKVIAEVERDFNKQISKDTVKRILKKTNILGNAQEKVINQREMKSYLISAKKN